MFNIFSKKNGQFIRSTSKLSDNLTDDLYIHEGPLILPHKYYYTDGKIQIRPEIKIQDNINTYNNLVLEKKTKVLNEFKEKLSNLLIKYDRLEIDSWDQQKIEAENYISDNTFPTPLLTEIANNRGIELSVLVDKVIANVNEYQKSYGEALGLKQKAFDEIQAIIDSDLTIQDKIDQLKLLS